MAASPADVRSVISSTFTPPACNARETFSPCSTESKASTGMTGPRRTISLTVFMCCDSWRIIYALLSSLAHHRPEYRCAHFRRHRPVAEHAEKLAAETGFVLGLMQRMLDRTL